jgi:hypothetical protein
MPGGARDLWQTLGSQHHERDYADDGEFGNANVKHTKTSEVTA